MSARSEWSLSAPQKLTFDEPVSALHVRIVSGTVNIVGTDSGPASLQLSEIEGLPLVVSLDHGILSIAYDDLPWKGFLKLLDGKGWQRSAHITLTVPTDTRAEVGAINAAAVISALSGRTEVRGVSGDSTLVGLTGDVRADTVSGHVEAQSLGGSLRFNSVSGGLTVIDGTGPALKADSVSGAMVVDIAPAATPTSLSLNTVSGDIAIRLPDPANMAVEAHTASGTLANAFDNLRVAGSPWGDTWGPWASPSGTGGKITGNLGRARGRLKAASVSGAIAVLRRPPSEESADAPVDAPTAGAPSGADSGPHAPPGPSVPTGPATPTGPAAPDTPTVPHPAGDRPHTDDRHETRPSDKKVL
ncbi:DUF4097 family beta strand repeat-containing protein [Streptomyces zagrosensis]|uniref:DUF4097 domain-containing protein n=1 Tax=Streptomyces zagrosensis TaxID=1042984 RepID=A0A7W9QB67_9ACTN|nr:DUF4097 family beta strand repeat-containing protein [Streptomyces zagrosensis]MBB5936906.1 hypothetical protein [Streptomyces zagrosensis]